MQQMPQQVQQQVQGIAENLERSQRRWAQHAAGHSLVIQEWGGGVRLRERVDQCVAHYLWTLEPKDFKKMAFLGIMSDEERVVYLDNLRGYLTRVMGRGSIEFVYSHEPGVDFGPMYSSGLQLLASPIYGALTNGIATTIKAPLLRMFLLVQMCAKHGIATRKIVDFVRDIEHHLSLPLPHACLHRIRDRPVWDRFPRRDLPGARTCLDHRD